MRSIRLVISRTLGQTPVVVLAVLGPAGALTACEAEVTAAASSTATGLGGSAAGGSGGSSEGLTGGTGGTISTGGAAGAGGQAPITCPYGESTFVVTIPPEGVPPSPTEICATPAPVESNQAARITLNRYSQAPNLATGLLSLDPDLVVVGTPTIEVVEAAYPVLLEATITNIVPTEQGFTFHIAWPTPFAVNPDEWASMRMRATMDVECPNSAPTTVESHTYVNWCIEQGQTTWVSSGDECTACSQVCEMAPGPTLLGAARELGPLARAFRLTLVPIVRVGRALVLLAQHDGGPGLRYRWECSEGLLQELAPDVVLWELPAASCRPELRVAAIAPDGVAAARFSPA